MKTRLLLLSVFLVCLPSFADGSKNKTGIEVQKLQHKGNNDAGYTIGLRNMTYLGSVTASNIYIGYAMNAGSSQGGRIDRDNIAYGGLLLGVDGANTGVVSYDLGTLVGYGYGSVEKEDFSGHSIAIQPTLSLGLILRSGYRASFSAGYLFMPSAPNLSTFTFGIRIERKSISSARSTPD